MRRIRLGQIQIRRQPLPLFIVKKMASSCHRFSSPQKGTQVFAGAVQENHQQTGGLK
jgi:hypothetical protein